MRTSKDQFKAHRRQVELDQYAWRNRRAPTESEARLWEALRSGKLGVSFRRQVPIAGHYIVDFLAPTARLVVEVDGGYHTQRARADARRERQLQRLGYRILRLSAVLVTGRLDVALQKVTRALGSARSPATRRRQRRSLAKPGTNGSHGDMPQRPRRVTAFIYRVARAVS